MTRAAVATTLALVMALLTHTTTAVTTGEFTGCESSVLIAGPLSNRGAPQVPHAVAGRFFGNDAFPDILFSSGGDGTVPGGVFALRNNGAGGHPDTFGSALSAHACGAPAAVLSSVAGHGNEMNSFLVVDMDGDGDDDLLPSEQATAVNFYIRNTAECTFVQVDIETPCDAADSSRATVIAHGDVNGDGHRDVVFSYPGSDPCRGIIVSLQDSMSVGTFPLALSAQHDQPLIVEPSGVLSDEDEHFTVADIDGDGDAEVISVSDDAGGWLRVLSWTGTALAFFQSVDPDPTMALPERLYATAIVAGDLNADGVRDIAVLVKNVVSPTDYNVYAAYGVALGGGALTSPMVKIIDVPSTSPAKSMFISDVNGDGRGDILREDAAVRGQVFVHESTGPASATTYLAEAILVTGLPSATSGGTFYRAQVADFDRDGFDEMLFVSSGPNAVQIKFFHTLSATNTVLSRLGTGASAVLTPETFFATLRDVRNLPFRSTAAVVTPSITQLAGAIPFTSKTLVDVGRKYQYDVVPTFGGILTFALTGCGAPLGSSVVLQVDLTCPPGSRLSDDRLGCSLCEIDTFSNVYGATLCIDCPQNTETNKTRGSPDPLNCTCMPTYWDGPSGHIARQPCVACLHGAVCPGLGQAPYAAPGYFDISANHDGSAFSKCFRPSACAGGPVGRECSSSTTGYMCNTCREDHYSSSRGPCEPCPPSRGSVSAVVIGIVLFSIPVFLLVRRNHAAAAASSNDAKPESKGSELASDVSDGGTLPPSVASLRTRPLPPTWGMIMFAFQVVGLLGTVDLQWSSSSNRALAAFNAFNFGTLRAEGHSARPSSQIANSLYYSIY
eukprot:c17677_g1_i1.p1 GENE.c17677_g1_i1~~c17677_g1_i1.p1  ORF type:complete len:840 (+),score=119.21 c17677_g1_i1:50-2569(+)